MRFISAVQDFDIWWVEEPLMPDDVSGHAEIRQRSSVSIATGELHSTRWDFRDLLQAQAADVLQPDAGVIGGVSEWMKVAHAASTFGLPVSPHWNANIHVHLAAAIDNCLALEYFALEEDIFNFEQVLTERLTPEAGKLRPPELPGLGLVFDEDALASYRIR
jgi:L-alanine-DL-glutamate epimerase-like enolase superfamily enzyme